MSHGLASRHLLRSGVTGAFEYNGAMASKEGVIGIHSFRAIWKDVINCNSEWKSRVNQTALPKPAGFVYQA